jgi:hypothetical protein
MAYTSSRIPYRHQDIVAYGSALSAAGAANWKDRC